VLVGTANDTNTVYSYNGTTQTGKVVRSGSKEPGSGSISETHTFAYNRQGRLAQTTVVKDNTTTVNIYRYNADGIRVEQTEQVGAGPVVTTRYLVDPQNHTGYAQVLEEENAGGMLERSYTIGHDVIAQWNSTNGQQFLLYDGHGSTRALLTAAAAILERYAYDAYGNQLEGPGLTSAANAATRFLYSGEQTDKTGLQYLRARYYDPRSGRFNRMDPFAGNIQDPLSLHKYLYANANPILLIDPSGMFGLAGFAAGFGIANSIRSIHTEVVLGAFDAAVTTIAGVQAGQTAGQIFASLIWNQALGFGIGYAIGKTIDLASSFIHSGIVIAPARRAAAINRPIAVVHSANFSFPRSAQYHGPRPARDALRITEARLARFNPTQRARVNEWANWGRGTEGVVGIRLDQAQLDNFGMQISANRPDLQLTLSGGRSYTLPNGAVIDIPTGQQRQVYLEFDPFSGGRGNQHLIDRLGDNPQGIVILDTFDNDGLASTITFNSL